MKEPPRPTWADGLDFSSLKKELARQLAESADRMRRAEVAEQEMKAAAAEAKRQTEALAAARAAATVEAERRRRLHEYVKGRDVNCLLHFTRLSNLKSILAHGLLPRSSLDEKDLRYMPNDELRLDGIDGVCLSIQFPNYKLFYKLRCLFPDQGWVVLMLSTDVLEKKPCIFNPLNAATSGMVNLPLETRMSADALEAMFFDREIDAVDAALSGKKLFREWLCLPSNHTTDPQAEIVVTESIEPSHVMAVMFDLPRTPECSAFLKKYSLEFGAHWADKFYPVPNAFSPRPDYKHWRRSDG